MIDANLVVLGGNSQTNLEWVEKVKEKLYLDFKGVYVHYYRHWSLAEPLIDLNFELEELANKISGLEPYVIFAKSAGALLALNGAVLGKIHPVACVFVGFPPDFGERLGLEMKWLLKNYFVPTFFMQKTDDPAMGAKELKLYLEDNCRSVCRMEEIPGSNHRYDDWEGIRKTLLRAAEMI